MAPFSHDAIGSFEKARDEAARDVKRDEVKSKYPEVPTAKVSQSLLVPLSILLASRL